MRYHVLRHAHYAHPLIAHLFFLVFFFLLLTVSIAVGIHYGLSGYHNHKHLDSEE